MMRFGYGLPKNAESSRPKAAQPSLRCASIAAQARPSVMQSMENPVSALAARCALERSKSNGS
jgi:hypothetical protein